MVDQTQWTALTPATLEKALGEFSQYLIGFGFEILVWGSQNKIWRSGTPLLGAFNANSLSVELPATGARDRVYRSISFAHRITVYCYTDGEPVFRFYWLIAEDVLSFRLYKKNELMCEYCIIRCQPQ